LSDGFGQRVAGVDAETGEQVELLEFPPQLVEHKAFVTALAERVAKLATVRHASYVHMRRLDRPAPDRLQLVSDLTPGWRLSDMLEESAANKIPIDITIVIGLIRQLLPAVALFSRHNRDAAIGILSAHRLIVTPQARLAIAEYGFGPAIEKLNLGREKLWREYRVSMPPSTGLPRANPRADVNAVGVVALTLLLGRSLELEEYPGQLESLLDSAHEHRDGQRQPLSGSFRHWLKRALQFDPEKSFQSPSESQLAFESVLASDRSYVTTSPALTSWVAEIGDALSIKRRPPAPPEPVAAPEPEPQAEPVGGAAAQPFEPHLRDLLVQSASALAQEQRAREQAELTQQAEKPAMPEPVLERAPERVSEPEPAPIRARAPIDDDDPIAKQLLTYQPKIDPPKAEPPEDEDPIAKQLRTYQPKLDAPPLKRIPDPPPSSAPARAETAEIQRDLAGLPAGISVPTEVASSREAAALEPESIVEPVQEDVAPEPAPEVAAEYVPQEERTVDEVVTEVIEAVAREAAMRDELVAREESVAREAVLDEVAEKTVEEEVVEDGAAKEVIPETVAREDVAPEPPKRRWWSSWRRRDPEPEPTAVVPPIEVETPAMPPQPDAALAADHHAEAPTIEPLTPSVDETPVAVVSDEIPAAAAPDEEAAPVAAYEEEEAVAEKILPFTLVEAPPPAPLFQQAASPFDEAPPRFDDVLPAVEEPSPALPLEPLDVPDEIEKPAPVGIGTGLSPLVFGLAAVAVVLLGGMVWMLTRGIGANVGELTVQSRPEGAQVTIDGEPRGVTPLKIRLNSGAHVLEVQSGKSEPRVIPLMIQGGMQTSQYVELSGTAATGGLDIRSEPLGARILIDGQNRGTTPMTIRDLSPGDHTVVLELRGRKASLTVRVQAGITTPLTISIP
jgi:hypothetical protein